jgi:hypothetical protein
VDMNQWSVPDYAESVQEALDNWMRSIWNYTETYHDDFLPIMTYDLYFSNINTTDNRDVQIIFTANTIPPGNNTVGLTDFNWNSTTFEPIPPINVTVTTFSGNATNLYVKNIVMHEFGHVLGLGHAYQVNTTDGPELMYIGSSKKVPIYPSTLDMYALTQLYRGVYDQAIRLPDNIPYIMLSEGTNPTGQTTPQGNQNPYLPFLIAASVVAIAIATLIVFRRRKKQVTAPTELPPPAAPNNTQEEVS